MKRLSVFSLLFSLLLVFPPGYAQNSSGDQAQAPSGTSQPESAAPASASPSESAPGSSTSRQELLAAERRSQADDARPPRLSVFERSLKWLEDNGIINTGEPARPRTITPMVGTIEYGSGLAAGVDFRRPIFQSSAAYSFRGYQQYDAQFGHNIQYKGFVIHPLWFTDLYSTPQYSQYSKTSENRDRGSMLYVDVRYRDLPQLDYYGLGPDSLKENRTDFLLQEASFTGVAGYQWNRRVRAAVRGGYISYNVGNGTNTATRDTTALFDDVSAPGLMQEPDFYMAGPALVLDFRDEPGNPHEGASFAASAVRYQPRAGDFAFSRFENDLRFYIPLGARSRVLALRVLGSFDVTSGVNEVPFYLQQTLGGNDTLRGYPEFRFRDKDLAYVSAEYRWEVAPAVELAVFYDTGEVVPDFSSFNSSSLKNGYGAGIRFKAQHSFLFRIDYGHSREDNIIIVAFSPSF